MTDEKKMIENLAQMYAYSLVHYGVDISEKLETATSMNLALEQAYLKGIEEGRKRMRSIIQNSNGWIPCNERLPNEYEEVLVYTYGNRQRVWCLIDHEDEYVWEDEFGAWNEFEDVVAWRSLPEPYKGE